MIHDTKDARKAGLEEKSSWSLLRLVGIDRAGREDVQQYPRDRCQAECARDAVLAIALAAQSHKFCFADEPTTALDVTIQAQILDVVSEISRKNSGWQPFWYQP